MAVFNSLTFDGENSLDYGVYITGEAVYNAPERAVEMISIPGRNGAIALDQGRFENIEVTYPAGTFGDDQPEFASKIRAFRNALASRFNYVKLTDSYHPDEYRLGLYKSGLTTTPVQRSKAGEFPIVFNCKPQRFLTSGETPVSIQSGATTTKNLLDSALCVNRTVAGLKTVFNNDGTITMTGTAAANARWWNPLDNLGISISAGTYTLSSNLSIQLLFRNAGYKNGTFTLTANDYIDNVRFLVTNGSSYNINLRVQLESGSEATEWVPFGFGNPTQFASKPLIKVTGYGTLTINENTATITGTAVQETYIDCDTMEIYEVIDGSIQSASSRVSFSSNDFPELNPAASRIVYSETISAVIIIPRWWII